MRHVKRITMSDLVPITTIATDEKGCHSTTIKLTSYISKMEVK